MKQSNWRNSGKPQAKPKQSHKRRKQKQRQLKNLAKVLKKGINQQDSERGLFYWKFI